MSLPDVLLDSGLVVLLVAGFYDLRLLRTHKNLSQFDGIDFDLLKRLIEQHNGIVVCPQVLAEASNLPRQIGDPARTKLTATLAVFVRSNTEVTIASRLVVLDSAYTRLGLTDAVLLQLSEPGRVLLSVDARLCDAALRAGHEAINFNHIRDARPDFN